MRPATPKSAADLVKMRVSGRVVAEVLAEVASLVRPGVRTGDLNEAAVRCMERLGATSSFLGYAPWGKPAYPAVICVSVDDEVVHGIPGDRELFDGQIVSIDCGVRVDGFHGDSAVTVKVGVVSDEKVGLMKACRDALWAGIMAMRPGASLLDIAMAISGASGGHGIVEPLGGHGIGRDLHELPFVANCPRALPEDLVLEAGMVLALEPILTLGSPCVRELADRWTVVTVDRSPSTHFEHTVAVTESGFEVLSVRADGGATH